MKNKMRYISFAAFVLAVATMVGCTKDDIAKTFTTTVEMPGGTKALSVHGEKTFAEGDRVKVTYDGGKTAISEPLTLADINNSGKSAQFTFSLDNPTLAANSDIKYEYPAAHEGLSGQDGTLATLASKYDYAVCNTKVAEAGKLPGSAHLSNAYAILKILLTDGYYASHNDTYRQLIVKIGSKTVVVNRTPAADPIYVAVEPEEAVSVVFEAANGKHLYTNRNTLTGITFEAGHLYPVQVIMDKVIGALSGPFKVDASGTTVHFAKGNLQDNYDPSNTTHEWRIAQNQYSFVGNYAANIWVNGTGSADALGAIDLFGWSTNANTYYGINNSTTNGDYSGTFVDWGNIGSSIEYNDVATDAGWFTLSTSQWSYLFSHHDWGFATVNGTSGIVILPDYWVMPDGCSFKPMDGGGRNYASNTYGAAEWTSMEDAGAVFLPAAGKREGRTVTTANANGYYWSSTAYSDGHAYLVYFQDGSIEYSRSSDYESGGRYVGHSVRLVRR